MVAGWSTRLERRPAGAVSLPSGLRQPISRAQLEGQRARVVEVDPVPDGDEDGFHIGLGAQDTATISSPSRNGAHAPRSRPGGSHVPTRGVLATPNVGSPVSSRGGRQTRSGAVGEAVPVADQHVRGDAEFPERVEECGQLPEGEQPGNIRESGPTGRHRRIDHSQGVDVERNHRSREPFPILGVRHIEPSDDARARRARFGEVDLGPEPFLDGFGFGYGGRPGVADVHHAMVADSGSAASSGYPCSRQMARGTVAIGQAAIEGSAPGLPSR